MKYPTPLHTEYYKHISENESSRSEQVSTTHELDTDFSWKEKNSLMSDYTESIDRRSWVFTYIPFVRQVYLCNSITFNSLHPNSDIDICIIAKGGYIRLARIFSWVAVRLLQLHRTIGKYEDNGKKICLSFYIDEDHTNLLPLRKRVGDIYLSYWIAHCVLLYTDGYQPDNHIFLHNKELLSYLPHHPLHQTIQIQTQVIRGRAIIRDIAEYILTSFIGKTLQYIISRLRRLILWYKTGKLSSYTQRDIVISSAMLKFHQDKRSIIQHKRKTNSNQ